MQSLIPRHRQAASVRLIQQYAGRPVTSRVLFRSQLWEKKNASSVSEKASTTRTKQDSKDQADQVPRSFNNDVWADSKYAFQGIVPDLKTTRPAPLNLPEPLSKEAAAELSERIKHYYHTGKAYVALYWAGVKNVWANYKTRQEILKRLSHGHLSPFQAATTAEASARVSYAEYELLLRTARDLRKLPWFALIFTICGEFTPLVVLAIGSSIVPATCVIPKQEEQNLSKILTKEQRYVHRMALTWNNYKNFSLHSQPTSNEHGLRVCVPDLYRLGFQATIDNSTVIGQWRTRLARSNLEKHCLEVLATAVLVQREGGWKSKSPQDMWEWGLKYGMHTLRTWAMKCRNQGSPIVSEDMKRALLPIFEKETQKLIDWAQKCEPGDIWKAGYNSPILFPERPDCATLRSLIEHHAAKPLSTTEDNFRIENPAADLHPR